MLASLLCPRHRPSTPTPSHSSDPLRTRPTSSASHRRCSDPFIHHPPLPTSGSTAAASVWHVLLPSSRADPARLRRCGMTAGGSWNAACDVRPARWLHGSDSEWLLFGVRSCCSSDALDPPPSTAADAAVGGEGMEGAPVSIDGGQGFGSSVACDYRVTGVPADGRCLFRAIAHGYRLRTQKEAPDDSYQKQLADDLRAQVAEELLKRRKEIEWFIEGDFEEYVRNIQQPYSWGGEPELLMAAHLLQTPITVFVKGRNSNKLEKIARYGIQYEHDGETPLNVLFYYYGHYDLVELMID